jgi:hypothetical protein
MNRFDTYQPIKFDVPMFTPDFAALEALQTQKQKTLDDFRNQTDLIASSIKDDPFDPTVKEKKIKDIMASKDAIVNEMLRNPAKGSQLLSQYQNTLKKDILFGDINKINARATDYEQKIADLKTQPLWNDPIWRKGALEEIKNSYGDFQTTEGFGKTKGDDFAHTFYTAEQADAKIKATIDQVAAEKYAEQLAIDPSLASEMSYTEWYKREVGERKRYEKLLQAALPQLESDRGFIDYFETEGKFRGLGEGQGKIGIKKDINGNPIMQDGHLVIDDSNLFGKKVHGVLNEASYDNHITEYQQSKNDRLARQDAHADQIDLLNRQAAIKAKQDAIQRDFEIRKLGIQKFLEDEKAKKEAIEKSGVNVTPYKGKVLSIDPASLNVQLKDVETKIFEATKNGDIAKVQQLSGVYTTLKTQMDDFMKESGAFTQFGVMNKVENADITNPDSKFSTPLADAWSNFKSGNILKGIGNSLLGLGDMATLGAYTVISNIPTAVAAVWNVGDFTATDIEKGTYTHKAIPGYKDALYQSALEGKSWDEFLKTSVGKEIASKEHDNKDFATNDTFGVRNSAYKQYKVAQEAINSGLAKLEIQGIPVEGMATFDAETPFGKKFKSEVKNLLQFDNLSVGGQDIRTHLASKYGVKPEDITIDEATVNGGSLIGDNNHIVLAFDYIDPKDDKGKKKLTFSETVDVSGGASSVLKAAQGMAMATKTVNPLIMDAYAGNSVRTNMAQDLLKLENMQVSSASSVGYIPHPQGDGMDWYEKLGISIKKSGKGGNNTYSAFQKNNEGQLKEIPDSRASNPTDILSLLEKKRLEAMYGFTEEEKPAEERLKESIEKAQQLFGTK